MFFNPSQNQSFFNSPQWMQQMQQMQGSGSLAAPAQQQNMAPQLPMASPQQGAGGGQMGGMAQAPQGQQPGFFGGMAQSPQGMASGLGSLSTIGHGIGSIPGLLGSFGSEAAGPMMSGAAGYSTGSGLLGGLSSLFGFL